MSTNYYFRDKEQYAECIEINKKIDKKIKEIIKLIGEYKDHISENTLLQSLKDICEVECDEIHIGKRSYGWKPSFERQEQYSSVRELKEFYYTNKDKYEIVNEYSEALTWDELQEELIDWNPNGKSGLCSESYLDEDGYIWREYEYF